MSSCDLCANVIDKDQEFHSSVKCLICEKIYHPRCVGYTKAFLKTLAPFRNFKWFCNSCDENNDIRISVLSKLRAVEESVAKELSDQRNEISDLKKWSNN